MVKNIKEPRNFLVAIFYSLLLSGTCYSQPITNGLIGYWSFDGSAVDASGNGADGIVTGATLSTDRNGSSNTAYSFYNDQHIITSPVTRSNKALTVSIWCYPTTVDGNYRWVANQRDNSNGDQWQIAYNNTHTHITVFYGAIDPLRLLAQTLQPNSWNHIVLRTDGNTGGLLEAWINNVHQGSVTLANDVNYNVAEEITFGGQGWNPTSGDMDGKVDDLMIFDRTLSNAEIDYLFTYDENSTDLWQENVNNIYYPGRVAINRSDLPTGYDLAVDGKIVTKEVKVTLTEWPDYVFEERYDLTPLPELEGKIKQLGHLPEIPSTNEVLANGIHVGEMNAKLLEKIEELTLYMIQLNKKVEKIELENKELKMKVADLQK